MTAGGTGDGSGTGGSGTGTGTGREVETLIEAMAKLPGLGPRSARRAVLWLLRRRATHMLPMAEAIRRAGEAVHDCPVCGNLATGPVCAICADPARATGEICVVGDLGDLWAMERGGVFLGRYHVLGGLLSALDGVAPEDLRIPDLVARVRADGVGEVILALDATVEGQTTAHYIADAVARVEGVRITSLAQGVPVGGELDYLDDGTIAAALKARRSY